MSTVGTYAVSEAEPWDPTSVGRKIRTLREERMMTVTQLAQSCEVTPPYIYQIESGILLPSLRIIGVISNVLRVNPRDLFD